jgi:uncharacterized protein
MVKPRRIFKIINENKLYVWLLIFIIAFNLLAAAHTITSERKLKDKPEEIKGEIRELPSADRIRELLLDQENIHTQILLVLTLAAFLSLIIGVILDIVFIVLKVNKIEVIKNKLTPDEASWRLPDVIRIIILFVFISYVINIGYTFFGKIINVGELDSISLMATNAILSYIIIVSLLFYFVTDKYKNKFKALGLYFSNFFKNAFLGIAGYVATVPLLILVIFSVMAISTHLKYSPEPQPLLDALWVEERRYLLAFLIFIICLVGPVIEELFFRGFVYTALRRKISAPVAILTSAVFFAWLHMTLIGFFPILMLGLLLAYLYEKSRTLVPSIIVHIVHNTAIVLFIYSLRGLIS